MTLTANDSFGGIAMRILYDGVVEKGAALVNVRPIPGGNNAYVDLGGLSPVTRDYRVYFASTANWNAFLALRGSQGSLVDTIRGNATAVLMGEPQLETRTPTSGEYIAQVSFLIVS